MRGKSLAVREAGQLGAARQRHRLAADGVLQAQQPRARVVRIVHLDRRGHLAQRQRAVVTVLDRLRLDRAEHRAATTLVLVAVRVLPGDVLVAPLAVRHQRAQVALGGGGQEQRGLEAEALGQHRLQPVDGRVLAKDVVADLGGRHRRAHRGGGAGHGIAAQIDAVIRHRSHPPRSRRHAARRAPWPRSRAIRLQAPSRPRCRRRPTRTACCP